MDGEKSTFIKVDKFDTIMSTLAIIRKKLKEAQANLENINILKQEEDITIQKWASDLNSVQAKLDNIESDLMNEE